MNDIRFSLICSLSLLFGVLHGQTGNIGIGTVSPNSKLHVVAPGFNGIQITGDNTGDTRIQLEQGGVNNYIFSDQSDGNNLKVESHADFTINTTGGNERMVVESGGDVGIGVLDATNKLHVSFAGSNGLFLQGNNTGDAFIRIEQGGNNNYIFSDQSDNNNLKVESHSDFSINTNGPNERVTVLGSNGNVGIGDSNPEFDLSVSNPSGSITTLELESDEADSRIIMHDPGNTLWSIGMDQSNGHAVTFSQFNGSVDLRDDHSSFKVLSNGFFESNGYALGGGSQNPASGEFARAKAGQKACILLFVGKSATLGEFYMELFLTEGFVPAPPAFQERRRNFQVLRDNCSYNIIAGANPNTIIFDIDASGTVTTGDIVMNVRQDIVGGAADDEIYLEYVSGPAGEWLQGTMTILANTY